MAIKLTGTGTKFWTSIQIILNLDLNYLKDILNDILEQFKNIIENIVKLLAVALTNSPWPGQPGHQPGQT